MSNDIGRKLKNLRHEKRITQGQLAEAIGITRSTISNYEIGRRTPRLKDLQNIAKVLGVGLDYFGIASNDEAFDLLARAQDVFQNPEIDKLSKEELYMRFMELYLQMKRND